MWRQLFIAAAAALVCGGSAAYGAGVGRNPSLACAPLHLTNAESFPSECQFYRDSSPWRTAVAAHPTLMRNSDAIVAHLLNGRNGERSISMAKVTNPFSPGIDYAMPYYVGTASDPAVRVHPIENWCAEFGSVDGSVMHIPANARPELGGFPHGDQHLIVLDVSGAEPVEWDFWHDTNRRPLQHGQAFRVGCAVRGDPYRGDGWRSDDVVGGTATAAGNLSLGALVRVSELQAGHIGHALSMQTACSYGGHVRPARVDGGRVGCADDPAAHDTPPMGAHFWWDEDCPTIAARTSLSPPAKAILCALHTYGGFETDTNGGGSAFSIAVAPESPGRYLSLGNADPVVPYMAKNTPRLPFSCAPGSDAACYQIDLYHLTVREIEAHLHVLEPGF